jgi:hypothetical protein
MNSNAAARIKAIKTGKEMKTLAWVSIHAMKGGLPESQRWT